MEWSKRQSTWAKLAMLFAVLVMSACALEQPPPPTTTPVPPTASPTLAAMVTPKPTDTRAPTATPVPATPTPTHMSTYAPYPTNTPYPTYTAVPTATPVSPTRMPRPAVSSNEIVAACSPELTKARQSQRINELVGKMAAHWTGRVAEIGPDLGAYYIVIDMGWQYTDTDIPDVLFNVDRWTVTKFTLFDVITFSGKIEFIDCDPGPRVRLSGVTLDN